jgi:hypothetical protein
LTSLGLAERPDKQSNSTPFSGGQEGALLLHFRVGFVPCAIPSAALKSNKSNPWSYLIYLTLFGTGFVV